MWAARPSTLGCKPVGMACGKQSTPQEVSVFHTPGRHTHRVNPAALCAAKIRVTNTRATKLGLILFRDRVESNPIAFTGKNGAYRRDERLVVLPRFARVRTLV